MKKQNLGLSEFGISQFWNLHGNFHHYQCQFSQSTLLAFLPLWDEDLQDLTPTYIENNGIVHLGDWIRCYPRARIKRNTDYITVIPYDPVEVRENRDLYYDNPFVLLYKFIRDAANSGHWPEAAELIRYEGGNRPVLAFDANRYFALGVVFGPSSDPYRIPRGLEPSAGFFLIELARTAGDSLKDKALNQKTKLLASETRDLIELVPAQAGRDSLGQFKVQTLDADSFFRLRHRSDLLEFVSQRLPKVLDYIRSTRLTWDTFLKPVSPEQQFELILRSSIPASILVQAFQGTPYEDRIPTHIKRQAYHQPDPEPTTPVQDIDETLADIDVDRLLSSDDLS